MDMLSLPRTEISDVNWSIAIRNGRTGEMIAEYDPDTQLKTASVGKLFTLLATARKLENGELDPATRIEPTRIDRVADSGLLYMMGDSTARIDDLCLLTGAVSDNMAANMLLSTCGIDHVKSVAPSFGYTSTNILDWVRDERTPDLPPTLSRGTARELSDLMRRLARGEALTEGVSRMVNSWISRNADLSMVASAFGLDPLAHFEEDEGITLRNKTGTIETARIDVGWVRFGPTDAMIAYAVLANWDEAAVIGTRQRVLETMSSIGAVIISALRSSKGDDLDAQ